MATVRFSQTALGYMVFNSNNGGYGQSYCLICSSNYPSPNTISGGAASSCLLVIYKGTPETFPSFTDRATRASDALVTFSLGADTASYTDLGWISNKRRFIIGKCLTQATASGSGLASWFLLCRNGTTTLNDKGAIVGTVGLVGSGSDLEISSTNITSGQYYTSAGFYVNFKTDYVF